MNQTFYRLTSEDKPSATEAIAGDTLVVLNDVTGKVDSYWLFTDKTSTISGDRWWQI